MFERFFQRAVGKGEAKKAEAVEPPVFHGKDKGALSATSSLEGGALLVRRTSETPQEQTLKEREPTVKRVIGRGRMGAEFVQLKDDGSAIFKAKKNEKDARDHIKPGTYYQRERAGYLVSRFLGLDLVPPTVVRTLDGEVGSVQQFVENAKSFYEVPRGERNGKTYHDELTKLWLLDVLIWNSDRHEGNLLLKDGKVHAIDNGLSFGEDELVPLHSYLGYQLPAWVVERLSEFFSWEQGQRILEDLLGELLPKTEVRAFFSRLEQVKRQLPNGKVREVTYS